MATTTNLAIPYAAATDPPDAPGQIFAVASRLDALATSGAISMGGSVTNIDSAQRSIWTQSGRTVTANFAVNVGSNGLSNTTGQLFAGAPAPISSLTLWGTMNVLDSSGSFAGVGSFQLVSDGTLRHYAWSPAGGGGPSNSIPANYRLTGFITYPVL